MSRGHPNCYEYRYDFFSKVVDIIIKTDNERILQEALSHTLSRLNEDDFKKFLKGFDSWEKPKNEKPKVNHREQLKKMGKVD